MSYYKYGKTEEYLLGLVGEVQPELAAVREECERLKLPILPATGAQLLKTITIIKKPKRVLEIGTAAGYSGLIILLNSTAQLFTIDFDELVLCNARKNFESLGMESRVRVMCGDASDIVPMIEGRFDLIFLDGPKGRYHEFLPYLINLLSLGGILLCDNVLYSGRMSGEAAVPKSKQTIAERLSLFIRDISSDNRLKTSILPIGDGMSLSVRVK